MLERRHEYTKLVTALDNHIKQDTQAHEETNDTLKLLIRDKAKRDEIRDKRDRVKEKIYVAVGIAVFYGAYDFFLNLYDISKALGVKQ